MNTHFRRAFVAGASMALLLVTAARLAAQSASATPKPADEEPVPLSPYLVTGSRLPSERGLSAVPVTVVGQRAMATSGESINIRDILRETLPQLTGDASRGLENAGSIAFFSMGGSTVTVHNLSTLILINGRRLAFDPAEAAVGDQFVDVNMIPPAAIDRVEILSDGASAIYGSDAVGGVVNIILKSQFNGWQAGAHWGESTNRGSYTERSGYVTGGVSRGNTSLLLSIEGSTSSPIYMRQRPYTAAVFGTTNYPGIIDVVSFQTGADTFYRLNPGLNVPPGGGQYTIDQLVAMGVYTPVSPPEVVGGFNLANAQTLLASLRRKSFVGSFEQRLAGRRLVLFADLLYGVTHTESSLNGQGMAPYVSTPMMDFARYGMSPPPPGFAYVPADQPGNPFSPDWINQGNMVTAHNLFTDYRVVSQVNADYTRMVAGLRGTVAADYSWEAAANLNRYRLAYRSPGQIDAAALNAAFAAGALNPFALTQPAGALPDAIIGARTNDMTSSLNSFDVLFRGTPLRLPGGGLKFAAGAMYTREHLKAEPDARSRPNAMGLPQWLGYQSFSPFNAERSITSYYGELGIPLTGPAQGIPALHSLTLNVAGRSDNYSRVGHSAVPQASVRWQPFDEQLTLRASGGRSYSAPALYKLFGPVQSGQIPPVTFNNYGGGQTQQAVFNGFGGANPDLQPAKANTWSAGFVFAPHAIKGLEVSFDYFQVVDKDEIGYLSIPAIVQGVESFGPASPYSQYVHIGGPAGPQVTGPGQLSTMNPAAVFIHVPLINLSSQSMKGFDATIDWNIPLPDPYGGLEIRTAATVYNSYLLQAIPTEDYYQYAGHASGGNTTSSSQGTVPRWRTYTSLRWDYHGVTAVIGHTYVASVTDIGPGGSTAMPPLKVGSYQQFDASLAYDFAKLEPDTRGHLVLRVGVNNAFNKMPPLAPNAFPETNADIAAYNGPIGRLYYVDLTYRF